MRIRRIFTIITMALSLIALNKGLFPMTTAHGQDEKIGVKKDSGVVVRKESGPSGHATIGIDESAIGADSVKTTALTFSRLMHWKYDADSNPPPPATIQQIDGRKVQINGFMYPLQQGESIQYFCLLRTTQTCCYGPKPQFNQYVLIEMEKPTRFFRLDPVSCVGKFRVEPTPDEGYIYRIEGQTCESISGKDQ